MMYMRIIKGIIWGPILAIGWALAGIGGLGAIIGEIGEGLMETAEKKIGGSDSGNDDADIWG